MKDQLRRAFVIGTIVLFGTMLSVDVALAQGVEGIQMSPAVINDRVDPGDQYRFSISVTNLSATDKVYYLSTEDITGLDEQGQPIFIEQGAPTSYELSKWVTLPSESVNVKTGETRQVFFTVRVPNSASPGAHFGGIFLDMRPPKQQLTGSAVGFRVGTIINLRIAGDITEEARLREFSTGKIVYSSSTVDFKSRLENLGNVLLRPHGVIEITNMRGTKVQVIQVNDSGASVFPGDDTLYTTIWNGEGFAFGRYQAVLSFVYGEDSRKTVTGVTSFWILPLSLIGTVLGVLVAIIVGLFVAVKFYINRKLREMGANTASAGSYARKYRSPLPRLISIALTILVLCVFFLAILFVLFA